MSGPSPELLTAQSILGKFRSAYTARLKEARERTDVSRISTKIHVLPVVKKEIDCLLVCARTRPLLPRENDALHYGVIDVHASETRLYQPIVKFTGPTFVSNEFHLDASFGPDSTDSEIYQHRISPQIARVIEGSLQSLLLLAYGQTGAGKTHTVAGIYSQMIPHLLDGSASGKVTISALEIMGSNAKDLLDKGTSGLGPGGGVSASRLVNRTASSPTELASLLSEVSALRATASTAKNDTSSRSHCIVHVRGERAGGAAWTVTVVDLAGSERAADSALHSKERRKETIDNNKALASLKACLVAFAAGKPGPWRDSLLTRYLRPQLCLSGGSTERAAVLIACVAPSVLDWSHSLNTLRYAEAFKPTVKVTGNVLPNRKVLQAVNGTAAKRETAAIEDVNGFSWYGQETFIRGSRPQDRWG